MRLNTVKQKWREGEIAWGAWLTVPSAVSAEAMARAGFDWVCVDMQHGAIDYADAYAMILAIASTDAMPFVRVPWNEPGITGKMLDAGAMGIIIPMTNSAAEAEAAVRACLYPPRGARSYGPGRVAGWLGGDYFARANDEVAVIPMIETKQAVDAIDEILAITGIDAVYVGPADLSISLGMRPALTNDGAWRDAYARIAERCAAHDVVAGIHANAALAAQHAAAGYRMVMISHELTVMAAQAAADIALARGETPAAGRGVYG